MNWYSVVFPYFNSKVILIAIDAYARWQWLPKKISSWNSREATSFDIEAQAFADQSSICLRVSSYLLRICDVGGVTFSDVISRHLPTAAADDWNAACVNHRWKVSDLSFQTWAARCLYAVMFCVRNDQVCLLLNFNFMEHWDFIRPKQTKINIRYGTPNTGFYCRSVWG
jgi:hypothetical protein